jgi:CHASE2 domain-containing sensor protein
MLRSWLIVLMVISAPVLAAGKGAKQPPPGFAVVFIDAATEEALGVFPYDRSLYAKGIEALARAEVRGVVLKFFIDRPKTAEGDAALAAAMKRVKVVLQARMDDQEPRPNPLPTRFILKGLETRGSKPLAADSGWLPLPALAEQAHDVGFLDSVASVETVPLVELYKGECVKSLYLAALELALGERAVIVPGNSVRVGTRKIEMDEQCLAKVSLPATDELEAYSFVDLVNGKIAVERLKDRVVIVGYDGSKMEGIKTSMGMVKGHRIFCYQLFSLCRELSVGTK